MDVSIGIHERSGAPQVSTGVIGVTNPNVMHYYKGVSKNKGKKPKMDGENNGNPYEQMDDLGVRLFLETPIHVSMVVC